MQTPRAALSIVLGLVILIGRPAHADPADRVIVVRLRDHLRERDGARIVGALRSQLADIARVEAGSAASGGALLMTVTIDAPRASVIELTFEDESGVLVGQPRSVLTSDRELVATEEILSIVRATTLALTERREKSLARSDAALSSPADDRAPSLAPPKDSPAPSTAPNGAPDPARAEAPAIPSPSPAPPRTRVRLLYTGTVYAPELPWRSGARLEALVGVFGTAHLGAGYTFEPPSELSAADVTMRVTRHAGSLFFGAERRRAPLSVGADVGLTLADTLRTTTGTTGAVVADAAVSRLSVGLSLRGFVSFSVAEKLDLNVALGVEAFPRPESYVANLGQETALLSPYILRPQLSVGPGFAAW